jgi:hypothetical protein
LFVPDTANPSHRGYALQLHESRAAIEHRAEVADRRAGEVRRLAHRPGALDAAAPIRFSCIHDRVEDVSQKVLTQALRQLERDGLITRTVYPEVPPRSSTRSPRWGALS